MKVNLIFSCLTFKGRIPSRKIRIETPILFEALFDPVSRPKVSIRIFPLAFPKCLIQHPYLLLNSRHCLIQYLYPPSLNSSHPLSPLLLKWLAKCTRGRKLQSLNLYKSKNLNWLLKMRQQFLILPHKLSKNFSLKNPQIKTSILPLGRERENALNVFCIHFPMLCHSKSCLLP